MRKTAIALVALCLAAIVAAPAMATVLFTDTFSYADGNLTANVAWANYSGATTDIQVASGRAVIVPAGANDDHALFAVQPTTSTTYACFTAKVPALAAAPKPVYFFELKDAGAANLVSRVYVLPVVGGGFTFGLSHSSTSASVGVVAWGSTLSYDTDYHVVVNYDPTAHSSTMWVDPVNEASTSVSITNSTVPALAVQAVGLRQSTTASTLPASPPYVGTADAVVQVDNLGAGTTFADACSAGTIAVTPSTWSNMKELFR